MRMGRNDRALMFDTVKRVDLKVFIEREDLVRWEPNGSNSWKSVCPLHKDSKPSFSVKRDQDGIWVYNCFGCNSGGTIIDYCMERFDIGTSQEALVLIMKKEGIKCDESLIIKTLNEAKVQTDISYGIDLAHFVSSTTCRILLRRAPDQPEVVDWIDKAYRSMNRMLEDKSTTAADLAKVGAEAARMINAMVLASMSKKET